MSNQPANECLACGVLRKEIQQLRQEVLFLRQHPALAAGMKGETLICNYTGGNLTSYGAPFDIQCGQYKLEVKWAKITRPVGAYRRWVWDKPLGSKDKGKDYDFLVLVGDMGKTRGLFDHCGWTGPYVGFLLPKAAVYSFLTTSKQYGSQIIMSCNPLSKNPKMQKLAAYRLDLKELGTVMKAKGAWTSDL